MPNSVTSLEGFFSYLFEEMRRSRRASYRWDARLYVEHFELSASQAAEGALFRSFGEDCFEHKKPPTLIVAALAPSADDAQVIELMRQLEPDGILVLFGPMGDLIGSAEQRSAAAGWRSRWSLQQLFFCDLNVCAAVVVKGWRNKPTLLVKFY
jgi:hypothetical protein